MFKMNKKGAEMTIGTIVMIILALVVLVVLVFGFSTGWSNLWQNIIGFGGGSVNVQTVVQACQVACSTSGSYDYCTRERSVVFEKGEDAQILNCKNLESRNVGLESCTNINCEAGVTRGLCSGTPSPDCALQNDQGEANCEKVLGCIWSDNANSNDANLGLCEIDQSVVCAAYNDDKTSCDVLRCSWADRV